MISPLENVELYGPLLDYVASRLDRAVDFKQRPTYAEINALVRSGGVSLALVCSGAFVVGRSDFGMEPLVVPVVNGKTVYHSYLIVPSSSPMRTWEDLRNKTFAFTDPLSNSGRLVPVYILSQMGERPEGFFKDSIFTYSHDKSVQAVAEGLVDGAAVDSLVYDFMAQHDPSITARTKVIWKSPPYGINPIVVHPDVDPELRRQLVLILLGMSSNAEGQRVLARVGIDSFTMPDPNAYDGIESMITATAAW